MGVGCQHKSCDGRVEGRAPVRRGGGFPAEPYSVKRVTWVFPPLHKNECRGGEEGKKIREGMSLQTQCEAREYKMHVNDA